MCYEGRQNVLVDGKIIPLCRLIPDPTMDPNEIDIVPTLLDYGVVIDEDIR
jgi:hypothetical protein